MEIFLNLLWLAIALGLLGLWRARWAAQLRERHYLDDERFVRDGDDLVTALDVPAPMAALGASFEVATLGFDHRRSSFRFDGI